VLVLTRRPWQHGPLWQEWSHLPARTVTKTSLMEPKLEDAAGCVKEAAEALTGNDDLKAEGELLTRLRRQRRRL